MQDNFASLCSVCVSLVVLVRVMCAQMQLCLGKCLCLCKTGMLSPVCLLPEFLYKAAGMMSCMFLNAWHLRSTIDVNGVK